VEASKAFQYPLEAHPESEDPEVVHHPARQIRLTCPESVEVEAEVEAQAEARPEEVEVEWKRRHRAVYRGIRLAYHRLAAASLHHRLHHHRLLCPYRE